MNYKNTTDELSITNIKTNTNSSNFFPQTVTRNMKMPNNNTCICIIISNFHFLLSMCIEQYNCAIQFLPNSYKFCDFSKYMTYSTHINTLTQNSLEAMISHDRNSISSDSSLASTVDYSAAYSSDLVAIINYHNTKVIFIIYNCYRNKAMHVTNNKGWMVTGCFPDRTFPRQDHYWQDFSRHIINELVPKGLAKKINTARFHVELSSWSLVLQHELSGRRVYNA